MTTLTLGLFHSKESAENAINELSQNGFSTKDISIIMKDQAIAKEVGKTTGVNVTEGIATGLTTGGILGGLTGLLVGIGAIIIPGIGGLLIAGPIAIALGLTGTAASTVTGALSGAVAGGLLGGLIGLGLPEEKAKIYETDIKAGGILIGVPITEASEATARYILEKNHADHIQALIKNAARV